MTSRSAFVMLLFALATTLAIASCGDDDQARQCPPDAPAESTADCIDETTCESGEQLAEVCTRCGDAGGCEIQAMRCLPTCPADGCGETRECRAGVCQSLAGCD